MSHFYTQIFTQNCLIDALGTCSEENCKKALIDSNGISTSAVRNLQAFWLHRASHIPKLSRWLSIYLGISACPCCMVHQIGYGGLENVILGGQWRCYPNKLRFKPTFLHSIAMHWELNPHWWSTTSIREKKNVGFIIPVWNNWKSSKRNWKWFATHVDSPLSIASPSSVRITQKNAAAKRAIFCHPLHRTRRHQWVAWKHWKGR